MYHYKQNTRQQSYLLAKERKYMNRIEDFLNDDFGVGGCSNYTTEQCVKISNVMRDLFDGDFACAELASVRDFLIGLNLDTESQPMLECIEEVETKLADM